MKEGPIALKRDPQIFGGDIVPSIPLLFKLRPFLGKNFGEPLHGRGNETIRLFHGTAGFVDEGGLNRIPPASQIVKFIVGK
jgi:hypothetical protein